MGKTGRTVKLSHHQIGRTHVAEDKRRSAMSPGRRISGNRKPYTENRRNRSDRSQKRHL